MTDATRILQRIERREQEALAELYDLYGSLVFTVCKSVVKDASAAESAVQATFLAVWDSASSFNPRRASVKSWLLSIARNKAIDTWRRNWRTRQTAALEDFVLSNPATDNPLRDAIESETSELVRGALQEIPDEQRRALYLAYFGGLSQSEISSALKIPLGTIKTRVKLGLDKLRKSLGTVLAK